MIWCAISASAVVVATDGGDDDGDVHDSVIRSTHTVPLVLIAVPYIGLGYF